MVFPLHSSGVYRRMGAHGGAGPALFCPGVKKEVICFKKKW